MTAPNTDSEEVSNPTGKLPVMAELHAIDPLSSGNAYEEPGETSYSLRGFIFDGLRILRHHRHKHGLPTV